MANTIYSGTAQRNEIQLDRVPIYKKHGRYQLIAGERRLRAIKDYTNMAMIQAKIANVDDLQANE